MFGWVQIGNGCSTPADGLDFSDFWQRWQLAMKSRVSRVRLGQKYRARIRAVVFEQLS
jgi:hypothetical protein